MHDSAVLGNVELSTQTPIDSLTKIRTIKPKQNGPPPTPQLSTPAIYEALRELRGQSGKAEDIRQHVKSLVDTSGEKANVFLYEALIAANWDPSGSAAELDLILEATERAGIPPSSNLYHDALKLLAIHPDYTTRMEILKAMKEDGVRLTPDGKISFILGLLRDYQYEMALEKLDDMVARNAAGVPAWVWDIFIYTLGTLGHVDESFRLLQDRLHRGGDHVANVNPSVWYFLLDECSKSLHYEGTEYIWTRLVETASLNPSDGTTLNVLNTAARHKDSDLATQAIQHLSTKRIKLGLQHYEPLLDCYAHNRDLENALRVLCIMNDAGLKTDPSSTRSIYTSLQQSPELLTKGPEILRELNNTYKDIPTSAMNVLIEALPNNHQWDAALDIYQQLRHLCRLGPNKRTFDLLREKASSAENIRFVVTELYMSGLRRDWSMYDALVHAYTLDDKLDDAFGTLRKITSREQQPKTPGGGSNKHWLRQPTLFALLECCFRHVDERAWWLIDEAKSRGVEIGRERVLEWVDLARRMEKERGEEMVKRDSDDGLEQVERES